MRVKDGQPKIQFQTFADMINFPVKPGEQPETSTFITEVLPLELLEGYRKPERGNRIHHHGHLYGRDHIRRDWLRPIYGDLSGDNAET